MIKLQTYKLDKTITRNTLLAVIIASLFLVLVSVNTGHGQSLDDPDSPQGGSIGISGSVPGPPPENAATINTPINGQEFTSIPITISGTCESGLIVEIYKNDVFGGSTECLDNATYELESDLFYGNNELIARVRDLLGQSGPDSDPVNVTYQPLDPSVTAGQQLLLTSDATYKGALPSEEISFPLAISGGSGPYAVSVTWGDGEGDVLNLSDTGNFQISHSYTIPGVYKVTIRAADSQDSAAFLQVTAVISGQSTDAEPISAQTRVVTEVVRWPLYVMLVLIAGGFWMGMRHQKKRYEI
ncbi:MAG: PKD domain-containing protein [Candidatus Saccharimonadales bacterium]